MKYAVFFINKESNEVCSYSISNLELNDLNDKVNSYNDSNQTRYAVIIEDDHVIQALALKESTETMKGLIKDISKEFDELRDFVNSQFTSTDYLINSIVERFDNLSDDKKQNNE